VANHKSAIKRARQNVEIRARQKSQRSDMRTAIKRVREAAATGDAEAAGKALVEATRGIDKAASKGLIHDRTAARYVSRLSRLVQRTASS